MKKLFLLGNPRSGTSLFRLMLNAHPLIASPPESGFIHWWYSKYTQWSTENLNRHDVTTYVEDVLSSKKIETWNLSKDSLINFLLEKRPVNYDELTEYVYSFWSKDSGKDVQVIVDKNNYFIHHLKDLNAIWPEANYLFLVRDGRDVACSYLDMQNLKTDSPYKPKLPNQIADIAAEWSKNNYMVEQHLQSLGRTRWQLVKYEDLVSDTETVLREVCEFLKLEFASDMLTYYERNKEKQDEPLSTLDWKKKTLEKPDSNNIGKYKSILSEQDINLFNTVAGKAIVNFGYEY